MYYNNSKVVNMEVHMSIHPDVLKHLESFDEEIQNRFMHIRSFMFEIIPHIEEKLGYGVPGYYLNGINLVYVACFKHHIGLYPGPAYIIANQDKLKAFKTSTETIRIKHHDAIPFDVIEDILVSKGRL